MSWYRDRHERSQQLVRTLLKHMRPEQQRAAIEEIVADPDVAAELIDAMDVGDEFLAAIEAHKQGGATA